MIIDENNKIHFNINEIYKFKILKIKEIIVIDTNKYAILNYDINVNYFISIINRKNR
jgi:hypothetical protein